MKSAALNPLKASKAGLMTTQPDPARRLAQHLNDRRLNLRLQWQEVADRAKITAAHLRNIRNGQGSLSNLAKANLEHALQWAPGSIDRILAGSGPVEVASVSGTASLALTTTANTGTVKPEEVERRYEDAAEQKIWEITELEPGIRKQLIALVRVMREALTEEDRRPDADVREFRPRG